MKRLQITSARYRTVRGSTERTIPSRFLEELGASMSSAPTRPTTGATRSRRRSTNPPRGSTSPGQGMASGSMEAKLAAVRPRGRIAFRGPLRVQRRSPGLPRPPPPVRRGQGHRHLGLGQQRPRHRRLPGRRAQDPRARVRPPQTRAVTQRTIRGSDSGPPASRRPEISLPRSRFRVSDHYLFEGASHARPAHHRNRRPPLGQHLAAWPSASRSGAGSPSRRATRRAHALRPRSPGSSGPWPPSRLGRAAATDRGRARARRRRVQRVVLRLAAPPA
jgi:hypothetical protein